jgi:protein-tyrosine-phosphatase
MAEALARHRFAGVAWFASAGLSPQSVADTENAVETLRREFGIDFSAHVPRAVAEVAIDNFGHIVAMDEHVAKELKRNTNRELIVWNIEDPWGDNPVAYKRCALEIGQALALLMQCI